MIDASYKKAATGWNDVKSSAPGYGIHGWYREAGPCGGGNRDMRWGKPGHAVADLTTSTVNECYTNWPTDKPCPAYYTMYTISPMLTGADHAGISNIFVDNEIFDLNFFFEYSALMSVGPVGMRIAEALPWAWLDEMLGANVTRITARNPLSDSGTPMYIHIYVCPISWFVSMYAGIVYWRYIASADASVVFDFCIHFLTGMGLCIKIVSSEKIVVCSGFKLALTTGCINWRGWGGG